jgi:hypothetical protein
LGLAPAFLSNRDGVPCDTAGAHGWPAACSIIPQHIEVRMLAPGQINKMQLALIAEIERNETWLLGERLGRAVDPKSPEVRSKVIEIVLACREQWRLRFEQELSPLN